MKDSGVTLVELLVVVSIVGILIVAMGFSYRGWVGNYRIESMTKQLYFDLSDARSSAMSRNRIHWAVLDTTQYAIFEDTDPGPDGDGILNTAQDARIIPPPQSPSPTKQYEYDYQLGAVGQGMPQTIAFDTRGLMSWVPAAQEVTFRFINTKDPDLDCIVIEQSKMWMGEYNTALNLCERR